MVVVVVVIEMVVMVTIDEREKDLKRMAGGVFIERQRGYVKERDQEKETIGENGDKGRTKTDRLKERTQRTDFRVAYLPRAIAVVDHQGENNENVKTLNR